MFSIDKEVIISVLAMCIPLLAIIGGITAGIVKTLGQQRLVELAQRERIAAIERGLDVSQLPPLPSLPSDDEEKAPPRSFDEVSRRRSQNLLIAGIITLAVGLAMMVVLSVGFPNDPGWLAGVIPVAVGLALLACSWVVRPKGPGGFPLNRME